MAVNPFTVTVPFVLTLESIVAVVVPFPPVVGVPINSTLKLLWFAVAFPVPLIFNCVLVIAAYATATKITASTSTPPTILAFVLLI